MNKTFIATKFVKLIDLVVPQGYLELQQQDVILRARSTIVILVACSLTAIYGSIFTPTEEYFPLEIQTMTSILLLVSAIAYMLAIALFRYTGSFFWTANLYAITAFTTLHLELTYFGGVSGNPLAHLIMLIPLMAFVIGGRTLGIAWTVINSIYILYYSDITPEIPLPADTAQHLQVASLIIVSGAILFGLYLFDLFNTQLRLAISHERNQFQFQAGHDVLTGLLNRASFEQRLDNCVEKASIHNKSSVIGLIDLDGFKPINDTIGHHAGDIVLEQVSERLQKVIRRSDTVARLGGDEFAFILEGLDNMEVIDRIASQILNAIAEEIEVDGTTVKVTGSIGLARFPQDADKKDAIVRAADAAMYKAKEEKGRYQYFHEIESAALEEV